MTAIVRRQLHYRLIDGSVPFIEAITAAVAEASATASGDLAVAAQIFDHLDTFLTNFPLVEP